MTISGPATVPGCRAARSRDRPPAARAAPRRTGCGGCGITLVGQVHACARRGRYRIVDLRRRGKYLIAGLDDGFELVIHLGMTGRLETPAAPDLTHPHLRAGGCSR